MSERTFWEKAQAIDRRWVFLAIALAVIIPMAFEVTMKEVATPEVQAIYDRVEELPEGSNVLVAFDFDPPSRPELQPMAISYIRHLAHNGHRIFMVSLWPVGQAEAREVVATILNPEFPEYRYGVDYVMLGFRPGNQGVIQAMLSDIRTMYNYDHEGTPVDSLPAMADVNKLEDFDLILNVSAGYPGLKEWVQFGGDPSGVPVAGGVTAVSAPLLYPYYPGQMFGIMGGLKAAAEYESLLMQGYPEVYDDPSIFMGIKRMGPQTWAHIVIILFILIGNIAFFATGGARRGNRLKALDK